MNILIASIILFSSAAASTLTTNLKQLREHQNTLKYTMAKIISAIKDDCDDYEFHEEWDRYKGLTKPTKKTFQTLLDLASNYDCDDIKQELTLQHSKIFIIQEKDLNNAYSAIHHCDLKLYMSGMTSEVVSAIVKKDPIRVCRLMKKCRPILESYEQAHGKCPMTNDEETQFQRFSRVSNVPVTADVAKTREEKKVPWNKGEKKVPKYSKFRDD